jgi:hypothetical protein
MSTLTNIQILRSAVPYKRPDPAFLLDGQLGINYKDEEPGLFTKLQGGGLVKLGPVAITTTGFAPNSSPDADGHPGNSVGEEWLDSRAALYRPVEHIYDGTNWLVTNGFEVDYNTGDFTLLKKLTISALETDVAHIDGPLFVNGDITPDGTTCAHSLGTLSERWDGIYACQGDISGNLQLGGSLNINQDLNIGGTLTVDQDLSVNGSATFGQACGDGSKFTVKSPTYLNCLVEILGHTQATDLDLSGDMVVEGDVTIGLGCNTTFNVKSKTIFECDVEFATNPVTFEYLVVTDLLDSQGDTILGKDCADKITVKGTATFENCITTLEGETRIGPTTGSALRTFGPNIFNEDIQGNSDLNILTGKGYSLHTLDTDPDNTLTTKKWVADTIAADEKIWGQSGTNIFPITGNVAIIPTGNNASLGSFGYYWARLHAFDLYSDGLTSTAASVEVLADVLPNTDNAISLGSPTKRYASTYTNDFYSVSLESTATKVEASADILPNTNKTLDLGSSTLLFANTYTDNLYSVSLESTATKVEVSADILPDTDKTLNLGSPTKRFANMYTGDLHLKNERGDWTLIEEEDCLTMTNNKTGKRYAISMTPYTG